MGLSNGGRTERERKERKKAAGKKTGRRKEEWVRTCSQAVRGNE